MQRRWKNGLVIFGKATRKNDLYFFRNGSTSSISHQLNFNTMAQRFLNVDDSRLLWWFQRMLSHWRKFILWTTAALCVGGMLPSMPYSYFMLLRIAVCVVMAWQAVFRFEEKYAHDAWLCVVVAVLFNPVLKIHLTRDLWWWLDGLVAVWCTIQSKNVKA